MTDNTMGKEKEQNEKQRIKQKTKDRETWTLQQIEGELRYSEMDNSSCSTCDTRCVTV
jgi:hypothetical protein